MGDLHAMITGTNVQTADGSTHFVAPVWRDGNPTITVTTTKTKKLTQRADGRFRRSQGLRRRPTPR